jgi:hypothetical protein
LHTVAELAISWRTLLNGILFFRAPQTSVATVFYSCGLGPGAGLNRANFSKGEPMRHLQDIWTVRNEFRRCSRWHIPGLALRKPQLDLLADIYLGLNVSILLLLGGLLENSPWIVGE